MSHLKAQTEESNTLLQEEKKQQHSQQSDSNTIFGSNPIFIRCPFCLQRVQSQVIAKPEICSILLGFLLFILYPGFLMIFIVMVALQVTATRKHRCSSCLRQLGSDGKFLIYFTDQIFSIDLFGLGIIVSKKIVFSILLIITIILVFFLRVKFMGDGLTWTTASWDQFRQICPSNYPQITPHESLCAKKFEQHTIQNWKGYVMKIQDNRSSKKRFYQHGISLYIKMQPTERQPMMPDLFLTADSNVIYTNNFVFASLQHGSQIYFNATFKTIAPKNNKSSENIEQQSILGINRHFHIEHINNTGYVNPDIHIYITHAQDDWIHDHAIQYDQTHNKKELRVDPGPQILKKIRVQLNNQPKKQMTKNEKQQPEKATINN